MSIFDRHTLSHEWYFSISLVHKKPIDNISRSWYTENVKKNILII